jgi:hypothetical protein
MNREECGKMVVVSFRAWRGGGTKKKLREISE